VTDLLADTSVAVPLLLTSHEAHRSVNAAVGDRSVASRDRWAEGTYRRLGVEVEMLS
jgi:hypothetical protein